MAGAPGGGRRQECAPIPPHPRLPNPSHALLSARKMTPSGGPRRLGKARAHRILLRRATDTRRCDGRCLFRSPPRFRRCRFPECPPGVPFFCIPGRAYPATPFRRTNLIAYTHFGAARRSHPFFHCLLDHHARSRFVHVLLQARPEGLRRSQLLPRR